MFRSPLKHKTLKNCVNYNIVCSLATLPLKRDRKKEIHFQEITFELNIIIIVLMRTTINQNIPF